MSGSESTHERSIAGRQGAARARVSRALRAHWPLAGITLLALGCRLFGLSGRDVWVDEGNAILIAQTPLSELLDKLALDSSPPLYFLMAKAWSLPFGTSLVSYRMLSVLGGVTLVVAVYLSSRSLPARDAASGASLLLAVSPIAVFHSQQARPYAWIATLSLLSTVALAGYLREGRRGQLVGWICGTVLALHLHATCLYLLPTHLAVIAWSGVLISRWRTWLAGTAVITLGFAPALPTLSRQLASEHYAWFSPHWAEIGAAGALWQTALAFSPSGEFAMYFPLNQPSPWHGIPAALAAAAAVIGAFALLRRLRASGGHASDAWPLALAVGPLVFGAIGSSVVAPHYVPSRLDQIEKCQRA